MSYLFLAVIAMEHQIAFEADRQGVSPSEIAEKYHKEFTETLIDGLGFSYDIFTKTATENHYKFVQEIFLDLYKKGFIYSKETELPYCKKCNKFLPDRYIEGECPHCHFSSARGDQCDECGSLIDPKQLIKPKCKICGNVPVWKNSEHFYFKLSAFQEKILEWIKNSKGWRKNAKNFSTNFVNRGLQDRAITRDISWGVPIPLPGYEKIKAFMSGLRRLSVTSPRPKSGRSAAVTRRMAPTSGRGLQGASYFIGKDNIPFHTIIWPVMLMGYGGLNLPYDVAGK